MGDETVHDAKEDRYQRHFVVDEGRKESFCAHRYPAIDR